VIVNIKEIEKIRNIVENAVGTLMMLQNEKYSFNEAEKLYLFMVSTRTLARVILWGTTINGFQYPEFLKRVGFGYSLDITKTIEYSIQYGCLMLNEIKFYENRLTQQSLIEEDVEVNV
jgi:hypothetical protein